MERVAKRFILYSTRDEKVKESDFDELKEKLQFARYEMMNGVKEFRENLIGYSGMIRNGLYILSEKVFSKKDLSHNILRKRNEFKLTQRMLNRQKRAVFKFNNFNQLIMNNDEDVDEEDDSDYESEKFESETNLVNTGYYNNYNFNKQSNQDDVSLKRNLPDEENLIS
jgi:hypothetical protein